MCTPRPPAAALPPCSRWRLPGGRRWGGGREPRRRRRHARPAAPRPTRAAPPLVNPCRGAPIEAAAILALLATLVGVYSLPGVAIVCAVVPLQYYFGFK